MILMDSRMIERGMLGLFFYNFHGEGKTVWDDGFGWVRFARRDQGSKLIDC